MDATLFSIERITDPSGAALRAGLEILLEDAVAGGASLGFHAPLAPALNRAYWDEATAAVARGTTVLLVAQAPQGGIAGSVQLALSGRQNGRHRAELQKLLVHSAFRRRGLGRRLLAEAEALARSLGRDLLLLDTLDGDAGVPLYESAGWTRAGRIPGYTIEADGRRGDTILFWKTVA